MSHNRKDLQYVIVPAIIKLVLIYLPLVVMGVYLLVVLCKWCKCKSWLCPVTKSKTCVPESHRSKLRKLVEVVKGVNQETDSNDEAYDQRCDEDYMSMYTYHRAGAEIAIDTYP